MIPHLTPYDEKVLLLIKNEEFTKFRQHNINNISTRKKISESLENLKKNGLTKFENNTWKYSLSEEIQKKNTSSEIIVSQGNEPFVYWNSKFSHSGITGYKVFENYTRKMSKNSLSNLLNRKIELENFNKEMSESGYHEKNKVTEKAKKRTLSANASKKCRHYSQKLCYYSGNRQFTSKKSGKYHFKVAFLTLTTPLNTTILQSTTAFNKFLDYLRRTANCVYVWKKELGEENKGLHYHILVNNFIPYYIVAWKWKKLLIGEGVEWQKNEKGEDTSSHYRIELPKKLKKVNYYISKYLAKECELPSEAGYIWGKSEILDQCKEFQAMACDIPYDEVKLLKTKFKTVNTEYISHVCVDLLKVKELAPEIFSIFEDQYLEFQEKITLTQKFHYV